MSTPFVSNRPNYIVFQCYGNEGVFWECAFALLSLTRQWDAAIGAHTEVWIYTDKKEWFSRFGDCPIPLRFREMDAGTLKDWRGTIDFVHRVKIEILKDFTASHHGNILYADTDVVFTAPIGDMMADIDHGQRYMHVREGKISEGGNPVLRKLHHYLRSASLKVNDQSLEEMDMWNAGVLGFNSDSIPLLGEVLEFTDTQYPAYPRHVVEQFAFSLYFQQKGQIAPAAPYITHYWNLKEVRELLAAFFTRYSNRSWADLVALGNALQMPVLMQEKANFYQNRSITDKLRKIKWKPDRQSWETGQR